jgi:hypothetical protein
VACRAAHHLPKTRTPPKSEQMTKYAAGQPSSACPPSGNSAGGGDRRVESLQSALTQTLGVPVSAFRKRNNVVSECRTNRVVAAGSAAERGERHLERDTHQTDRFAVERLTV